MGAALKLVVSVILDPIAVVKKVLASLPDTKSSCTERRSAHLKSFGHSSIIRPVHSAIINACTPSTVLDDDPRVGPPLGQRGRQQKF